MGDYPFAIPDGGYAPGLRLIYADDYGADPTGAQDSTAAFRAAQAAGGSSPYVLVMSAGTYLLGTSQDLLIFERGQGLIGQGAAVTSINYVGAGTCLNFWDSSFSSSLSVGGPVGGFAINGYSAASGAIGMRWGDLNRARCRDIQISGFNAGSGSIGLYLHNVNGWSEQGEWTGINLVQSTANVIFDTNSFDYSIYQFLLESNSGQDGIRLQGGANLQGVRLEVRGNFNGGAGNTGAVIAIDRGNTSGTSFIKGALLDVAVEADGSGTGHYTILMGSTNSVSQFAATGVLYFYNAAISFQGVSNSGNLPFGFSGVINDTTLGTMTSGDGIAVKGGIDQSAAGALNSNLFLSNIYLNFGDIIAFQLVNGAQTLTFNSLSTGWARRVELLIAQPASGAAGTVTWPANVKWPNATPPTLSSINGYVDKVRMTYLPASGNWYAELAGSHYA